MKNNLLTYFKSMFIEPNRLYVNIFINNFIKNLQKYLFSEARK